MLRKHRLKEAVEWMQITNSFVSLDKVFAAAPSVPFGHSSASLRRVAMSPPPPFSANSMGGADAAAVQRPGSAML